MTLSAATRRIVRLVGPEGVDGVAGIAGAVSVRGFGLTRGVSGLLLNRALETLDGAAYRPVAAFTSAMIAGRTVWRSPMTAY